MEKRRYHDDQACIADNFSFLEKHIAQVAKLAVTKINSYKLSLLKASLHSSKEDFLDIIRNTLLNYVDPMKLLSGLGFFDTEIGN